MTDGRSKETAPSQREDNDDVSGARQDGSPKQSAISSKGAEQTSEDIADQSKKQDNAKKGTAASPAKPATSAEEPLNPVIEFLVKSAVLVTLKTIAFLREAFDRPYGTQSNMRSVVININNLGYFLDGWADLIEGMGAKAIEVRKDVLNQLKSRDMPDVRLTDRTGYVRAVGGERRHYIVSNTHPGATTTIYIAKHGKDLYASWRTFIKPMWNVTNLMVAFIVAAILGFLIGGGRNIGPIPGNSQDNLSLIDWIATTLFFILLEALLMAAAGRVLKGNSWTFFYVEPNVFDAEDITAMGLSAHKSILRALDSSGIDVSKLRLKQTFKGGRRGEEV